MSVPINKKKEKYLMDKKILSIIRKVPKRGIWMKELAEKLKISRPLLNYYLFGMKKKENWSGGRIRSEIFISNQGNNRFISLKENRE